LGFIPYDEGIRRADAEGEWLIDLDSEAAAKIRELTNTLIEKAATTLR
jgi:CheY-specific phosphatase CheX